MTSAVWLLYSAPHENEKESWSEDSEEGGGHEEARDEARGSEEATDEAHGTEEGTGEARGLPVERARGCRSEEATGHVHTACRRGHRLGAVPLSPAVAGFARR